MSPTEVGQELETAVRKILERHGLDFIDLTESRDDVDFVIIFRNKAKRIEVKNHNQKYHETKYMIQQSIANRKPDVVIGSLNPSTAGLNLLLREGIDFYPLSEQLTPFNGALVIPQIERWIIYLLVKYTYSIGYKIKWFLSRILAPIMVFPRLLLRLGGDG